MDGQEVLKLIIDNFGSLSTGTVALIAALKVKIDTIEITKYGMKIIGAKKEKALDGDTE